MLGDWNTTGKSNCFLGDVRIFLRVSKKKEENLPTLPKIVEGKLGQEDKSGMGSPLLRNQRTRTGQKKKDQMLDDSTLRTSRTGYVTRSDGKREKKKEMWET